MYVDMGVDVICWRAECIGIRGEKIEVNASVLWKVEAWAGRWRWIECEVRGTYE